MSLLALADVKPHLRVDQTTDDTILQAKLDSAESWVSHQIGGSGTLAASAVTQRCNGFRSALILTTRPINSVTSVTGSDGVLVPLTGLDIDLPAGLIRSNATYYYAAPSYPFLLPFYTVIYQAGYATAAAVPEELKEAVRLMTQHFYSTQRGPGRRATGNDPGTAPDAYARARQITDDITVGAGFA